MSSLLLICLSILALSWSATGLAYAYARWMETRYWDGPEGRDPGDDDPRNPFKIDPTDPGDWWKYDRSNRPAKRS